FRAYRLPADIRQRRAGIRFKKSQLRLISALWNHEAWTQHDALNEQLWRSMKLSDGADVEIDRDVESTDGEEDCEDEDKDDSDNESSVVGADDSETDDMDDADDEDDKSEEEDHDRSEDQSRKNKAMRSSGGEEVPPWAEEVLELLSYSRITSRNALRFLFLTNHRLAFAPYFPGWKRTAFLVAH
ncbi:hypothetical protein BFJ69_g17945, partial [Fusarium oxysporum]